MRRSILLALAVVLACVVTAGMALVTEPAPPVAGTTNTTKGSPSESVGSAPSAPTTIASVDQAMAGPLIAVGSAEPDSSVEPASGLGDQDFHEVGTAKVVVPCDSDGRPSAPDDPICLAQWVGFHVGVPSQTGSTPLAEYLTPQLAAQLSTFESTVDRYAGAVLLENAGQQATVGPGEASVQLIIEKTDPHGQISLTILDVIVTLTPDGWRVATIDLAG